MWARALFFLIDEGDLDIVLEAVNVVRMYGGCVMRNEDLGRWGWYI